MNSDVGRSFATADFVLKYAPFIRKLVVSPDREADWLARFTAADPMDVYGGIELRSSPAVPAHQGVVIMSSGEVAIIDLSTTSEVL